MIEFTWKGIVYEVVEDQYELPPKSTPQQIYQRLQDTIGLREYQIVDALVQQGKLWKYLLQLTPDIIVPKKAKSKIKQPKQSIKPQQWEETVKIDGIKFIEID